MHRQCLAHGRAFRNFADSPMFLSSEARLSSLRSRTSLCATCSTNDRKFELLFDLKYNSSSNTSDAKLVDRLTPPVRAYALIKGGDRWRRSTATGFIGASQC